MNFIDFESIHMLIHFCKFFNIKTKKWQILQSAIHLHFIQLSLGVSHTFQATISINIEEFTIFMFYFHLTFILTYTTFDFNCFPNSFDCRAIFLQATYWHTEKHLDFAEYSLEMLAWAVLTGYLVPLPARLPCSVQIVSTAMRLSSNRKFIKQIIIICSQSSFLCMKTRA